MAAPLRSITAACCGRAAGRTSIPATAASRVGVRGRCHHVASNAGGHRRQHRHAAPLLRETQRWGPVFGSSVDSSSNHRWMKNNITTHQRSSFSSVSSSHASQPKSFKRVIRPFLRACHPDAMLGADAIKNKRHPLSERAKSVNLEAVQTINGLVDVLDELIGRCTPPSYSGESGKRRETVGAGSLPELKARYEVEFILPTGEQELKEDGRPVKRRHRDRVALSQRSITVSFPTELREDARKWALAIFPTSKLYNDPNYQPTRGEIEAFEVAMQLREHAYSEFLRLLTIAGLRADPSAGEDVQQEETHQSPPGERLKEEGRWTLSDHFLHELGIDPTDDDPIATQKAGQSSAAFFGRTQSHLKGPGEKVAPPTYSHPKQARARRNFMNSIKWDSFAKDYDQAFLDASADWTTTNLNLYNVNTLEGRERREKFVSQICSGVRIWRAEIDGVDGEEVDELDEIPEGLDVVAQLVAIRRLSLILYDNFDHLQMERMGRMWENLVVVLTPPREGRREKPKQIRRRDDGTPIGRTGRKKLSKWERKRRRREGMEPVSRGSMRHTAENLLNPKKDDDIDAADGGDTKTSHPTESGFKFSYGTQSDQGAGHVTAYIPVDFRDDELVRQLYTHLRDYFDNCCGHVGFLRYGADGTIRANVNDGGSGSDDRAGDERMRERRMGTED